MSAHVVRKIADKNALRPNRGNTELYSFLRESPRHHLLLTAGNLLEAFIDSKGTDPTYNFIHDFEALADHAKQVFILKEPSLLKGSFKWRSEGLEKRLISQAESKLWQKKLPTLIKHLRDGNVSEAFLERSLFANRKLAAIENNHEFFLNTQRTIGKVPYAQKEDWECFLRTGVLPSKIIALVIQATIGQIYTSHIVLNKPLSQPLSNTLEFRYILAHNILALERRARGKQSNFQLAPKDVRNDVVDMIYVAQASYFDGFFCFEKTSNRVYRLLDGLLSSSSVTYAINHYTPPPEILSDAYVAAEKKLVAKTA